jgi:putative ABC transport system permease protein
VFYASYNSVTPGYFEVMGISLLKGRKFTEHDNERSTNVVIVNEALVNRYWPGENVIGKRITVDYSGPTSREIIGVVHDIKHTRLTDDSTAELYVPFDQSPWISGGLVVRTTVDPTSVTSVVLNELKVVDSDKPAIAIETIEQIISRTTAEPRFYTTLLAAFATVALLLATFGIYGVISYSVSQRTQEIGIRMTLGAQPKAIIGRVLFRGFLLSLLGVGSGSALAVLLTRHMSDLLYNVSTLDQVVFFGIPLLLLLVSLTASYLPARRAARIDPIIALR